MRKVELRMNEQMKYETIKELVDHHGNKRHAALKLGLSIRSFDQCVQSKRKSRLCSWEQKPAPC